MYRSDTVKELLNILNTSEGKKADVLSSEISQISIPLDLKQALYSALSGDNRLLNSWLFTQNSSTSELLVWVAPIRAPYPIYAWMLGHPAAGLTRVRELFKSAHEKTFKDLLLAQRDIPPPLMFVEPIAISSIPEELKVGTYDEFAIFQTNYKDTPVEVSDFHQRMVLNVSHLASVRLQALKRLDAVCAHNNSSFELLENDPTLYGMIHSDGHNQGHYVGSWPYEDDIKKHCFVYEAVEELRACLASVLIVEKMPLSEIEKDAYAIGVFVARFFGYGYNAFCLTSHRRETAREITVGMMLFGWLRQESVLRKPGRISSKVLEIDFQGLRHSLIKAFKKIEHAESATSERRAEHLKAIASAWYNLGFPNAHYCNEAINVYNAIGECPKEVM